MNRDRDLRELARVSEIMKRDDSVFVFGSNTKGSHGGGAARTAHQQYGARWGLGEGPAGQSYAIPTMRIDGDGGLRSLRLDEIRTSVDRFIAFATEHAEKTFAVTRVGCGIAGFNDAEIAPLFVRCPDNCVLPEGWRAIATSPNN